MRLGEPDRNIEWTLGLPGRMSGGWWRRSRGSGSGQRQWSSRCRARGIRGGGSMAGQVVAAVVEAGPSRVSWAPVVTTAQIWWRRAVEEAAEGARIWR